MVVKRINQEGWVTKRLVHPLPPLRPQPPSRDRDTLVQALLAEIASGDSVIKLYAFMLAQEIITHDPKLARKYRRRLDALQE